jgi:hypothetical protein
MGKMPANIKKRKTEIGDNKENEGMFHPSIYKSNLTNIFLYFLFLFFIFVLGKNKKPVIDVTRDLFTEKLKTTQNLCSVGLSNLNSSIGQHQSAPAFNSSGYQSLVASSSSQDQSELPLQYPFVK